MTERELLEPLIIVEDEDISVAVSDRDTAASPSGAEAPAHKEKEEHSDAGAMPVKGQSLETQQRATEEGQSREDKEEYVNKNEDLSRAGSEGQMQKEGNPQENQREEKEKGLTSTEQQPEEEEKLKDLKEVGVLTPSRYFCGESVRRSKREGRVCLESAGSTEQKQRVLCRCVGVLGWG